MANTKNTISENRYSVELDGIPAFKATKVSGGGETHSPVMTHVGNEVRPFNGRGKVEPEDLVVTIPSGLYDNALRALNTWTEQYADGINTAPKSGRYIVYDDTGRTPIETYQVEDAIPVSLKPDDKSGEGTGTATVTLTIKPYRTKRI